MAKITPEKAIALREDLIVKLQAQKVSRQLRMDTVSTRIKELEVSFLLLASGITEVQNEIDEMMTQINELKKTVV